MKYTGMFSQSLRSVGKSTKTYDRRQPLQNYNQIPTTQGNYKHRAVAANLYESQEKSDKIGSNASFQRRSSMYTLDRINDYRPSANVSNVPTHRHQDVGSSLADKYARNYESKYAAGYEGMSSCYRTPKASLGRFTQKDYEEGSKYRNYGNRAVNQTIDYPSHHNTNHLPIQNILKSHSNQYKRQYDYNVENIRPQTGSIVHKNPPRTYEDTSYTYSSNGKELLKNLDKVQDKIRSLLQQ